MADWVNWRKSSEGPSEELPPPKAGPLFPNPPVKLPPGFAPNPPEPKLVLELKPPPVVEPPNPKLPAPKVFEDPEFEPKGALEPLPFPKPPPPNEDPVDPPKDDPVLPNPNPELPLPKLDAEPPKVDPDAFPPKPDEEFPPKVEPEAEKEAEEELAPKANPELPKELPVLLPKVGDPPPKDGPELPNANPGVFPAEALLAGLSLKLKPEEVDPPNPPEVCPELLNGALLLPFPNEKLEAALELVVDAKGNEEVDTEEWPAKGNDTPPDVFEGVLEVPNAKPVFEDWDCVDCELKTGKREALVSA